MIDSVGLALYGRRAYELMLSYWPNAERNPRSPADLAFARKMNALPKLVLSRTLGARGLEQHRASSGRTWARRWPRSSGSRASRSSPGRGRGWSRRWRGLGLVDEYRLIVQPVVLGKGTPLFQGVEARRKLRLTRTTQLGRDLAVLCYEPIAP